MLASYLSRASDGDLTSYLDYRLFAGADIRVVEPHISMRLMIRPGSQVNGDNFIGAKYPIFVAYLNF